MIGCIIQARTGSSRLPGKVMKKVDDEHTVLYYVIKQLQSSKLLEKIVVATTDLKEDDAIEDFAKKMKISIFRGNSVDVLDRYYMCAKKYSLPIIVRITADNPLIDPSIVDDMITRFTSNTFDYVTNSLVRTFPYGTEVEIFSFEALKKAWKNAKKPSEREHVTSYFYNNPKLFKIDNVKNTENISHLSWTVDRENDLKLVKIIISKIDSRPVLLNDILSLLEKEPEIFEINNNSIPNEGYQKSLRDDERILNSTKNREKHEKKN